MIRFTINGKEAKVQAGTKLIDAARMEGYSIPSLCYDNRFPHYTSCMVCMVKDNHTGRFFASCSAVVEEGMDIDTGSEDVLSLRKKSVELLLLEHRAECEAPCRLVCPMDLDVPLMNRLIAAGDMEKASTLTFRAMGFPATLSYVCPAYCDNSCRRKKVDTGISICRLKRYVASHESQPLPESIMQPSTNKRVAIAGAGPSGLSAAFRLALAGHSVTIFEKEANAGGSLQESISSGLLLPETFNAELNRLENMGVNISYNTTVDEKFAVGMADKFMLLINATGAELKFTKASEDDSLVYQGDTSFIGKFHVFATGGAIKDKLTPVRCFQYGKATGDAVTGFLETGKMNNVKEPGFNSTLGKVDDNEWNEWVKESTGGAGHYHSPESDKETIDEASRCMHCDCRAAESCGLREKAALLEAKNPREKFTAIPIEKKINNKTGLIFEHAKCIKCGLCVRLGNTLTGQPTLCFKGRGYGTMITEPLYHTFEGILNNSAGEFVTVCPTGALEIKD